MTEERGVLEAEAMWWTGVTVTVVNAMVERRSWAFTAALDGDLGRYGDEGAVDDVGDERRNSGAVSWVGVEIAVVGGVM